MCVYLCVCVYMYLLTGVVAHDEPGTGIRCCDYTAYKSFGPLFDGITKTYHKVDTLNHPAPDFGDLKNLNLNFSDLDPKGTYIKSTRVRVGRTLEGFPNHQLLTHQVLHTGPIILLSDFFVGSLVASFVCGYFKAVLLVCFVCLYSF